MVTAEVTLLSGPVGGVHSRVMGERMGGSGKGGGAVRGMQAGKRRVSEELAELGLGQERLRHLVEEQWWCRECRELRTRSELDGVKREGQMIFVCLACGEIVEAIPF